MKNIAVPLLCLLIGGGAGYGVRSMREPLASPRDGNNSTDAAQAKRDHAAANASAGGASLADGITRSVTADAGRPLSLTDQMKELLVDFDPKSARKALAKMSATDLQAALALVAAMPKSADRDSLRAQIYRAWAAMDFKAAWQAALNDPLDKDKGSMLGAVAGELAKKNPQEAIGLAQSLGMGGRRTTVMNEIFKDWSKLDVAAALGWINAHPDQPVDSFVLSSGLSALAERQPMQAANLASTIKDEMQRGIVLANVMSAWVGSAPAAAFDWAQALTNPSLRQSAIAAAVAAWAKVDPQAALAHAQGIADGEARVSSFKKGWSDWFRSDPAAAASYLAGTKDDALLQSVRFDFAYFSENFAPKERAALLAQIPDGKFKEDVMRSVADSEIRKGQFNQAMELLNTMPDSTGRDRNVVQLGQAWAKADINAAAAWLKVQPDSSDRDLATAGYAGVLAGTDPATAIAMAQTIPDSKVRDGALKNVAVHWLRADAAKAEAWMSTVPGFSATDKRIIRSTAGYRNDSISIPVTVGKRR